jgi:hypothetical protein
MDRTAPTTIASVSAHCSQLSSAALHRLLLLASR